MLDTLYIENIAVIEKTAIEFEKGFNIMTGETGAGKSIVIDSINCVIGGRASKDLIRTGCQKGVVSGEFSQVPKECEEMLNEYGFSCDEELIITREILSSGRSTCRINGMPAPLSVLKAISPFLINIHGQHESYELMSDSRHLGYLDSMGDYQELLKQYKEEFDKYKEYKRILEENVTDEAQRMRETDILTYQVEELRNAQLRIGEFDELTAEKIKLSNSEKIRDALADSKMMLDGRDFKGACELADEASSQLSAVSGYMPEAEKLSSRLTDVYYELRSISEDIEALIDDADIDPYRLNEIEERLDLLYRLRRKYGESEEEMIAFLEKSEERLFQLENFENTRKEAQKNYDIALENVTKTAEKLTEKRIAAGKIFKEEVEKELAFLNMKGVRIEVSVEKVPLNDKGWDKVEFLISSNPGEPPKPVSKIASGGELSRMMLAIKTVLSKNDITGTLIFDEVDTGISGSASQKVGMKLKQVSKNRQVICVTHQPQIAALADIHFLIKKSTDGERTYTEVTKLDEENRIKSLAALIGGAEVGGTALEHAKKLIEEGKNL